MMSLSRFGAVCIVISFLFACDDKETSTELPYQPAQRDMSTPIADLGIPADDMGSVDIDDGIAIPVDNGVPAGPQSPNFGELLINEVMYDPQTLIDDNAEWIELRNMSNASLNLNGCSVVDGNHRESIAEHGASLNGLIVEPGDYVLLSRTDDMTLNGGLNPDAIFTFALSNSGDELFVVCGNIEVDVVAYDDGETFPNAKGFSIVRGTDSAGMPRWCPASSVYDDVNMERGTPGADNDPCGELIAPSCWAEIDCAMGEYCMSGTCGLPEGSCRNDMDCALGEVCEGGRCEIFQRPCEGDEDCSFDERCGAMGCEPAPQQPVPVRGQIVISEFMYNPHGPITSVRLDDNKAEWIELANLTDQAFSLEFCTLSDSSDVSQSLGLLVIPANGRVLLARSLDPAENGGLFPQVRFDFGLNNSSNGDLIRLTCDGVELDVVEFVNPTEPAQAYQRSLSDLNRPNDDMSIWCGATEVYLEDPEHFGTPLMPNTECQ